MYDLLPSAMGTISPIFRSVSEHGWRMVGHVSLEILLWSFTSVQQLLSQPPRGADRDTSNLSGDRVTNPGGNFGRMLTGKGGRMRLFLHVRGPS